MSFEHSNANALSVIIDMVIVVDTQIPPVLILSRAATDVAKIAALASKAQRARADGQARAKLVYCAKWTRFAIDQLIKGIQALWLSVSLRLAPLIVFT